jgi:hypothetical protein
MTAITFIIEDDVVDATLGRFEREEPEKLQGPPADQSASVGVRRGANPVRRRPHSRST